MLIFFYVLEHKFIIVVSAVFWIVFALNLYSSHRHVIDSNLAIENVVLHATSYALIKVQLFQFVGSNKVHNLGVPADSTDDKLVNDRIAEWFCLVLGKV